MRSPPRLRRRICRASGSMRDAGLAEFVVDHAVDRRVHRRHSRAPPGRRCSLRPRCAAVPLLEVARLDQHQAIGRRRLAERLHVIGEPLLGAAVAHPKQPRPANIGIVLASSSSRPGSLSRSLASSFTTEKGSSSGRPEGRVALCALAHQAAIGPVDQDDGSRLASLCQPGIDFMRLQLGHAERLARNGKWTEGDAWYTRPRSRLRQKVSASRKSPSRPAHWSRRRRSPSRSRRSCPSTACRRPASRASLASSAKCGPGFSSAGGMHISPSIASPCTSRQRATKATASRGAMPAFCGSSPILTWTKSRGVRPCLRDLLGQRGGDLLAVDRLDDVEQRHRLARLVGLQRPDQMQLDVGIVVPSAPAICPAPPAPGSRRTRAGRPRAPAGSRRPRRSWRRRPASPRPAARPASRSRRGDPLPRPSSSRSTALVHADRSSLPRLAGAPVGHMVDGSGKPW